MAVNQVSLFFYPPRWQQRLTPSPRALTDLGTPVQLANAIRVESVEQPVISCEEFREWLGQHNFISEAWGRERVYYSRAQVASIFGNEKEIAISFGDEAGELTHVYCRFTLTREAPALSRWTALVVGMCQKFQLRLSQNGVTPCYEDEFIAAVKSNKFWGEFTRSYRWAP